MLSSTGAPASEAQEIRCQAASPPNPVQLTTINRIFRSNCRERLYTLPMLWTARQPQVLGCQFNHRKSCEPVTRPEAPDTISPPAFRPSHLLQSVQLSVAEAQTLATTRSYGHRWTSIASLLPVELFKFSRQVHSVHPVQIWADKAMIHCYL